MHVPRKLAGHSGLQPGRKCSISYVFSSKIVMVQILQSVRVSTSRQVTMLRWAALLNNFVDLHMRWAVVGG